MKHILIYLLLIILSNKFILAQNNEIESDSLKYIIYGLLTLPQGDFSAASGEKAGYGETGFGASIDVSKFFKDKMHWISSVSFSKNSFNEAPLKEAIGTNAITVGDYYTIWGLTGVKLSEEIKSNLKIYGIGQIGILYSLFPDVTFTSLKITQTTKPAIALAYGIGAGAKINNINIVLKYCSGEPEYEQSASVGNSTSTAKVKLPASLLLLQIGFDIK